MTLSDKNARTDCLIGHTGFVGATLRRQASFSALFNSTNISEIEGKTFDTVVCAAAPGSMFEANRFPEADKEKIQQLIEHIRMVQTKHFILISSIAVLEDFASGDDEETSSFQERLAYGRNRRHLEAFVEEQFPQSLIVRLPALFGPDLRKNFIFDLLNPVPTMLTPTKFDDLSKALTSDLEGFLGIIYALDPAIDMYKLDRTKLDSDPRKVSLNEVVVRQGYSATQFHNPETTYQYYDMSRLWSDISVATEANLSHIHLVSEPLKAARIHERLIGKPMPETRAKIHNEDMRTRHAALWRASGPYLMDAEETLERLAAFFAAESAYV